MSIEKLFGQLYQDDDTPSVIAREHSRPKQSLPAGRQGHTMEVSSMRDRHGRLRRPRDDKKGRLFFVMLNSLLRLRPSYWLGRARLSKKLYYYTVIGLILLIGGGIFAFQLIYPQKGEAAWFNDNWLYRKAINISAHTSAENYVYIELSGSNAIDTSDTSRFQADCGDLRFTDQSGKLLPYFIVSGCGTTSTVIHVNFETFPAGAQTIYYYYGNPSAENGFSSSGFPTAATNYTIGSFGTEEKGPGPLVYWAFDEGYGSTAYNATAYASSSGALNAGITGATWQQESQCVSGKCLYFNGNSDAATSSANINLSNTNVVTLSFWMKVPSIATTEDIGVEFSSNFNTSATGFDFDYRLASTGKTQVCNKGNVGYNCAEFEKPSYDVWHHYEIVFDKGAAAATEVIPYVDGIAVTYTKSNSNNNTNNFGINKLYLMNRGSSLILNQRGYTDDLKIYDYARTAEQAKADFAARGSQEGSSGVLGAQDQSYLSNGLVGFWKMDETAADQCTGGSNDSCDSSGNGFDGTWNGDATASNAAKFAAGTTYDGTGDFTSVTGLTTVYSTYTTTAWVKTSQTDSSYHAILRNPFNSSSNNYSLFIRNGKVQTYNGIGGTFREVISTTTVADGTWHHVAATYDGATLKIFVDGKLENSANYTGAIGTAGTMYFGSDTFSNALNGVLDEIRIYNRPLSSDEVANLYNFAPGPVGYWQFEEHQGVTASDTSSYGNTGTLITNSGSPRWVAGKYGGAIKVKQGDSSYIDVADSASLSPTSVSISFWTKLDSLPTGGTASFLDKNNTYGVDVTTAGALIFQYNGGNSFTANTTLVTNKWYYITAVFDPTTGWQSIYINGVLDKTRISGSTGISDTATTLRIGGNQGTGRSISGIVDEVRVYNFPLTTKQIVSDMNASHPSVGSPIGSAIGWWQFDDGYGTVASDSGFLRKNGSLYRATWSDDSKFGKALFFDGNSYVQLGNVSEYKLETKSVSFWAKPGSAPAATQGIVAAGSVANWYVGVTANAGSKMILSYANSAGTQKTVNSTSNIDVVNWHHYAYTFSVDQNSNVTLKMYIDGKLDKTTTNTDGYSGTYGSNFLLGSFAVSSNFYKGLLDEVRIYNYELSASEVKLDMNQGKSLVLGAFGMDSSGVASNSANATYCVPGDTIQACAPTGEWTFEEGYGNVTNDMTGGGSNGVWRGTGTRWVQGKIGKAGYFNGADSSVNTNGQFSFTSGQSFTLAAWIKSSFLESSGANTYSILSKGCGFVGTYALWYRASTTNADAYFCIHPTTGGGSQISAVGTTKIHDNKWHYLVGVRDVTADNIYIYVDGKLEGTTADTTTGDFNRSATVLIGARGVDTLEKFTGSIDQAQIYNYALSPAQVAWNYNRGKPVAYYDLDECQGSTLHEFYNTGIDQTITIGGSGTTAIGTCTTSSSAWGGASGTAVGKYNYALTLDGTDDYASTSGTVMIAPSQSTYTTVSWGGWFNPVTGVASKTIIEKNREFRLTTDASSQPNCSIWNAGNWVTSAVAGTALPLSSWSHVMCVYDGTTLRVYVNGMSSGSVSQTNAITSLSYTPLSTARDFGGSAFYKGQVDDVQIFNYPLTAVQVRNLYNQSSAIRFGPLTGTP